MPSSLRPRTPADGTLLVRVTRAHGSVYYANWHEGTRAVRLEDHRASGNEERSANGVSPVGGQERGYRPDDPVTSSGCELIQLRTPTWIASARPHGVDRPCGAPSMAAPA